jgi:exodeoxyribonuclease VII large subunit
MAVPARLDLLADLAQKTARLTGALSRRTTLARAQLERAGAKLPDLPAMLGAARQRLDDRAERLTLALPNYVQTKHRALDSRAGRLRHPREILAAKSHNLASIAQRLATPLPARLRECSIRLESTAARLNAVSYEAVLARGFALVTNAKGAPVISAAQIPPGAALRIRFTDGAVEATAAKQGRLPL